MTPNGPLCWLPGVVMTTTSRSPPCPRAEPQHSRDSNWSAQVSKLLDEMKLHSLQHLAATRSTSGDAWKIAANRRASWTSPAHLGPFCCYDYIITQSYTILLNYSKSTKICGVLRSSHHSQDFQALQMEHRSWVPPFSIPRCSGSINGIDKF